MDQTRLLELRMQHLIIQFTLPPLFLVKVEYSRIVLIPVVQVQCPGHWGHSIGLHLVPIFRNNSNLSTSIQKLWNKLLYGKLNTSLSTPPPFSPPPLGCGHPAGSCFHTARCYPRQKGCIIPCERNTRLRASHFLPGKMRVVHSGGQEEQS